MTLCPFRWRSILLTALAACIAAPLLASTAPTQTPETNPPATAEATQPACGRCAHGSAGGGGCSGHQALGLEPGVGEGEPGPTGRHRGGGQGGWGGGEDAAGSSAEGADGFVRGRDRPEMRDAHALLERHDAIERRVEEIPGGVRTVTTSSDPELQGLLRRHVSAMVELMETGGRIRNWDPLFVEIFDRAEDIELRIEEVEGGLAVSETSADPGVVKLIRAHAAKVDEFVAWGWDSCREQTPLPEDYRPASR